MDAFIILAKGRDPVSEVVDAVADVLPDAAMYALSGHDDFDLLVVIPAAATGGRGLDAFTADLRGVSLVDDFVIMQGTPAIPTSELDRLWTLGFDGMHDRS